MRVFNVSFKKVGGLRFLKIGRLTFMFCVSRPEAFSVRSGHLENISAALPRTAVANYCERRYLAAMERAGTRTTRRDRIAMSFWARAEYWALGNLAR